MSKHDKAALSENAKQRIKERTDDLIDSDEFALDSDFEEEEVNLDISASSSRASPFSSSSRRKLEDYLEERRLRRELADDFDL